jgi:hypothetical protein
VDFAEVGLLKLISSMAGANQHHHHHHLPGGSASVPIGDGKSHIISIISHGRLVRFAGAGSVGVDGESMHPR